MGAVIGSGPLLDLLEPGWRRELAAGALPVGLDVEPEMLRAAAAALGEQARRLPVSEVAGNWPGCVVVALTRVASAEGSFWPAWHRMARARMTRQSADQWGQAFLSALGRLGMSLPGLRETTPHAAVHAYLATAASEARPAAVAVPAERRPRVRLDPFGRGVVLMAEARPQAGSEPRTAPETGAGPRLRAVPGLPVAERSALPDEVADPDDPLLVFDENGEPVELVLPADIVWALYPADRDLRSDVPPRVIVTGRPPLTWRGWQQVQLDLHGASWLGLDVGTRRTVRGRTTPTLRAGVPIAGCAR